MLMGRRVTMMSSGDEERRGAERRGERMWVGV